MIPPNVAIWTVELFGVASLLFLSAMALWIVIDALGYLNSRWVETSIKIWRNTKAYSLMLRYSRQQRMQEAEARKK